MNTKNIFAIISLILILMSIVAVFYYAPIEQTMGIVQKIFYFHVASAWTGFLAFCVVFVGSILFLWKKKEMFDYWAYCSAEIGVLFTSLVLVTGPLWAKPIWNTFWTWDPRLTTTLILWLIYIGYLLLRNMIASPEKAARISAVYGIIGFVDVPIVYLSIRLWRTLHPEHVIIMGGEKSGLDPRMSQVLMLSLAAFTLLFLTLLLIRVDIERMTKSIDQIRKNL
ncbi:MAG: cytochrome c biogenesis protein CcsA [bacterium]|nr:MAG: cytochrome c biogenesis protein CcsA [bacterium]